MNSIKEFVESYSAFLQAVATAQNPSDFLQTQNSSFERNLLLCLTKPYDAGLRQTLRDTFKLRSGFIEEIITWKKSQKMGDAEKVDDIRQMVEEYKKINGYLFDLPKPAEYIQHKDVEAMDKQIKVNNVLPEIESLQEWAIQQIDQNQDKIQGFQNLTIKTLPQEKLLGLKHSNKSALMSSLSLFSSFSDQFILEFLSRYSKERQEKKMDHKISNNVLCMLTNSCFEKLKDALPYLQFDEQYVFQLFARKFNHLKQKYNKDDLTIIEKNQKRQLIIDILDWHKAQNNPKLEESRRNFSLDVLELDIQREDFNQEFFFNFLEQFSDQLSSSKISLSYNFRARREEELMTEYFKGLFKLPNAVDTLAKLNKYFEQSKLNKIYAETFLLNGGDTSEVEKYLDTNQIRNLKQRKSLQILSKTKRKLKVDDDVELKLKVKNLSKIKVKVYQIDLEKQYLEGMAFNTDQDLSYLNPTESFIYQVDNSNPFKEEFYDIKVEQIGKTRGKWIVDLQADEISSRALIIKGGITIIEKTTTNGLEISFFNQAGNYIQDMYIWMNNKKHSINKKYVLPFSESRRAVSFIGVYEKMAEQFSVSVPSESYNFRVGYIYGHENFIAGNKCRIVLHPRLSIQGEESEVNLGLIQKGKIKVEVINNLNIKNSIDFENVVFKNNEDYVLEFPIQSITQTISIWVQGFIKLYSEKEQKVDSYKKISIDLNENNTNFTDIYLKKTEDRGYCLFVLGKNGEPITQTQATIYVSLPGRDEKKFTLHTDEAGSVSLGNISEIALSLKASVRNKIGTVMRQWNFGEIQSLKFNPPKLFKLNQQINLPYPFKVQDLVLMKMMDQGIVEEKISEKIVYENCRVKIQGLSEGQYHLSSIANGIDASFTVLPESSWANQNQIFNEKEGLLVELPEKSDYHICFESPSFQAQEEEVTVKIPISTMTGQIQSDIRAHLIASSYAAPNLSDMFEIGQFQERSYDSKFTNFEYKSCEFYNNKTISEEASYVLNRQNQKKYIGNNLEKPRIFLKRIQVRDTNEVDEVLKQQMPYRNRQMLDRCCAKKGMGYQNCMMSRNMRQRYEQRAAFSSNHMSSHNNFLSVSGHVISNEKAKILEFKIPRSYTHYQVILVSPRTALIKKFDYPNDAHSKKTITHEGISETKHEKGWTMSRQVYKVFKGENIKVGRNSTWCAVGLQNILNFAKIKGARLEDWVGSWDTFSEAEKKNVYDDKVCHELNCYIKQNDPHFFDTVVKPFISNKLEKTFVDLCLLENPTCLQWTEISKFQKLNQFEKVLLVKELMRHGKKEKASQIAQNMGDIAKANKISFNSFKNQFDTIITAEQQRNLGASKEKKKMKSKGGAPRMMKADLMMAQEECELRYTDTRCDEMQRMPIRPNLRKPFKEMEKTKQYTETTYSGMKDPSLSSSLVGQSPFWSSVALSLSEGKPDLLTENFMYLTSSVEFTLATCFLPNHKILEYNLKTEGEHTIIQANNSFIVYVKEVKQVNYEKKFGVLINQRFFDPDNMHIYEEDGTRIEKQAKQFILKKPYMVQTLVTNTSGTQLELQILIDLPKGSIPLMSHEYTKIQNLTLSPYSTRELQRIFYFPEEGNYPLYPANATRGGTIIAKAESLPPIQVKKYESKGAMQSFQDILKSGDKEQILNFLSTKNIFDDKVLDLSSILWMLKDKDFYLGVIDIFRRRSLFTPEIWMFGYLHEDITAIKQLHKVTTNQVFPSKLSVFEYFPYYSSRTHKFQNENKATIRNTEFKNSYFEFLFASAVSKPPKHYIAVLIYYLLLQDKIQEASQLLNKVDDETRRECAIQFDYIECFIDMSKGYPSFGKARKISEKYAEYPVKAWQRMFQEVINTLKEYDSQEMPTLEKKKVEFEAKALNEGHQLRLSIPPQTQMEVLVYEINLQLYFSMFPFETVKNICSYVVPNKIHRFQAGEEPKVEILERPQNLKDSIVEVYTSTSKLKKRKVVEFQWNNPKVQIQTKEQHGLIQVYVDNKKCPGCYCKVYEQKGSSSKFYRDGYTDITGTFKYALANLDGITKFSVLVVTQCGGNVLQVKPPSVHGYF